MVYSVYYLIQNSRNGIQWGVMCPLDDRDFVMFWHFYHKRKLKQGTLTTSQKE